MKKLLRSASVSILGVLMAAPLVVSAAINESIAKGYADSIINLINRVLVPTLIAIAFIVFLWGVFKYFIWHGENEQEKAEGRKFALWGIIGFVIIVSVWGLVNIVMSTLGLTSNNAPPPPTIWGNSGGTLTGQAACQQAGGVYNPSTGTCTGAP